MKLERPQASLASPAALLTSSGMLWAAMQCGPLDHGASVNNVTMARPGSWKDGALSYSVEKRNVPVGKLAPAFGLGER